MYAGNCQRVYGWGIYRQEGEKQMFKKLNKMKIGVRLKNRSDKLLLFLEYYRHSLHW